SLIMPAEAMWQRAAWLMQPAIMRELHATPFSPASVASPAMVGWAVLYTLVTIVVAVRGFAKRGLSSPGPGYRPPCPAVGPSVRINGMTSCHGSRSDVAPYEYGATS